MESLVEHFLLLNLVISESNSNQMQQWYFIELSKMMCEGDNWVVEKIDLSGRKIPQNPPYPRTCVALGSVIYMICGHNDPEPKIIRLYYFDMSNPGNEWLEGPSMNVAGDIGSVVVHEEKIYVFGGFTYYTEDKPCSGEVYDPVLNSWEPINDPPKQLDKLQGKFVGSYDGRKILVHPCWMRMLYAYDVVDKSWEILDHLFGFSDWHGVIMDDVLYVFDYRREQICGYDLFHLKWLKSIDLDNLEWFSRIKRPRLGVMYGAFFFKVEANVLCLCCEQIVKNVLEIYSKMFTIKKIVQEDGNVELEVEVISSTIYQLRKSGYCSNYVVI